MFSEGSVDLIYNCGTLEYFDRFEVIDVLREWNRVLRAGGTLRISVPNFKSVVKVYLQNGEDLDGEGILGLLYGRIEIETTGQARIMYHRTVYDFESLEKILHAAGFNNVRTYNWEEVLPEGYDDYSMAYVPYKDKSGIQMSLNVECIK
jgi:predicted SAM-dependent methyltransferase